MEPHSSAIISSPTSLEPHPISNRTHTTSTISALVQVVKKLVMREAMINRRLGTPAVSSFDTSNGDEQVETLEAEREFVRGEMIEQKEVLRCHRTRCHMATEVLAEKRAEEEAAGQGKSGVVKGKAAAAPSSISVVTPMAASTPQPNSCKSYGSFRPFGHIGMYAGLRLRGEQSCRSHPRCSRSLLTQ